MNINTGFIAIKEVDLNIVKKSFTIPKKFDGESRFVEVVATRKNSLFKVGELVVHEKAIPYFIASEFGENCFFIPEAELNAKIIDGNFISINELVYVDTDKTSNYKKDNFTIDHEYNQFREDIVTQSGTVVSVPLKASNSFINNSELDIELEAGDKVYTHHFLTHEDNEITFNGKKVYSIRYEECYCRIRNGELQMLNEWNFIEPIKENEKDIKIGSFKIKNEAEDDTKKGIVKYASKKLKSVGVNVGDTIFFKKDCDKKIIVEGEVLFRVNSRDIVAKLK